ncbi:MAG TPA: hypothetical protein VHP13_10060, partial [Gammaproteobacteria bacterium]|nr:hypothetical protein [Gammaproteobacteria bacterium]
MHDGSFGDYAYHQWLVPLGISLGTLLLGLFIWWIFCTALNSALTGWVTLADHYRSRNIPKTDSARGYVNIGTGTPGRAHPPMLFAASKEGLHLW